MKIWILSAGLLLIGTVRPSSAQQPGTPAAVVNAFHYALAQGDSAGALALLDPSVIIFESGGVEASRDEYDSHHLGADMMFEFAALDDAAKGKPAAASRDSNSCRWANPPSP